MASASALLDGYRIPDGTYDELVGADGRVRPEAAMLVQRLEKLGAADVRARRELANRVFRDGGITFSVYNDGAGTERIFPFDPIPRLVDAATWARVERGLIQRVTAINLFLQDIYGRQQILADGAVPRELLAASRGFMQSMQGVRPPGGAYVHISGIDLIRDADGTFTVLEDNVRTPSGVSYVLENRAVMKRAYPTLFRRFGVRAVDEYPMRLRAALESVAPESTTDRPRTVLLTPGQYNSAYFEHCFLARRMGVDLVQGSDLFVHDDRVWVKTTRGPKRVDVIYRRLDDAFLDPEAFRKDSALGVSGLMRAYVKGHVTIANAVGNGIADDKAVYPFVPDMIKYYLGEDAVLPQVPTFICARPTDRNHVLANLGALVVKSVDEAGGYGMLMGPQATRKECAEFAEKIKANPRGFIAQPLVNLSSCPTLVGRGLAARRVDLRPYVVTGTSSWVLPGGLTRVALRAGSYVVNSSQGGGSKDTWVLADARTHDDALETEQ